MPRLVPLKSIEIIKKLRKLGFEGPVHGGRHSHMIKGSLVIPVPIHGGKDIGVGLISTIISEIGISNQQRIDL